MVGIETKIKSSDQKILDFLEEWGALYQKIVRWSTTRLLQGKSKNELLPTVQSTFNIDWAWADSILTDACGIISSAEELRKLNIENIETDIKSGIKKVEEMISEYNRFVLSNDQNAAKIQAFQINNKLARLERRTDKLVKLRNSRLIIDLIINLSRSEKENHLKEQRAMYKKSNRLHSPENPGFY